MQGVKIRKCLKKKFCKIFDIVLMFVLRDKSFFKTSKLEKINFLLSCCFANNVLNVVEFTFNLVKVSF